MDNPKAITDSQIEEMIYFSLKESVEFAKTNEGDFELAVEGKLKKKYAVSDRLAAAIARPVYWYLSTENKYIPNNGTGLWKITEEAKNLADKDFQDITKKLLEEYRNYIKSNFESSGYKIQ